MSDKQFLDYDGLKHYHELASRKSSGGDWKKEIEALKVDIVLIKTGMAYLRLKVTDTDGIPLGGVLLGGFKNSNGEAVDIFTDPSGNAEGYITPGSSYTITSNRMLDIQDGTYVISNVVAGNVYSGALELTVTPYRMVTNSTTKYMSDYFSSADVELIGGGGGGAGGCELSLNVRGRVCGGGGGGGETVYGDVICEIETPYSIEIGGGGNGGSGYNSSKLTNANYAGCAAYDGGQSSAFGLIASGGGGGGRSAITTNLQVNIHNGGSSVTGGSGGSGTYDNGNGTAGKGYAGRSGTLTYHTSLTETAIAAGGGGGGGDASTASSGYGLGYLGGQSKGGRGSGNADSMPSLPSSEYQGELGSCPGGGGGGAYGTYLGSGYQNRAGKSGGSGACILLFHS